MSLLCLRAIRRGMAIVILLAFCVSLHTTTQAQSSTFSLLDKFENESERQGEPRDLALALLQVQPQPINGALIHLLALPPRKPAEAILAPTAEISIANNPAAPEPLPDDGFKLVGREKQRVTTGFRWEQAFRQSMLFLGIQHVFRFAVEEGTRADLKGRFFKDYWATVRSLRGWNDGDPFIVNYIGHPTMGAVSGFIQVQNDPRGINQSLSTKREYWHSRLKAFGWAAAYSAQFELGLMSEASLGNIGIRPKKKAKHPMAYVDLVITPVIGTGWLVGEDALDKYLIRRLENKFSNRAAVILLRGLLNPTRSFANILGGKWPWFRNARR